MQNGHAEIVQIIDSQGRLVIESDEEFLELQGLQSGIYLVRVLSDGSWTQKRFIKTH